MRTLERMHPAVCFVYLISVLIFTAVAGNPVAVLTSLFGAVLLSALSDRLHGMGWSAVFALLAALANFIFVHNGSTVLFFIGDTAFTLEALVYGVHIGIMLTAVCLWGACAVRYVTSDKYIWLFGRIFPAAGLVLSCAIRFVPLFIRRTREFAAVQQAGSVRDYLRAFSASVGYSAEQAMDSSLSMKARGYGTARRTSFSLFRFTGSAALALGAVIITAGGTAALSLTGAGGFRFYPAVSEIPAGAADIALYAVFLAFCLLPSAVIISGRIRGISK